MIRPATQRNVALASSYGEHSTKRSNSASGELQLDGGGGR